MHTIVVNLKERSSKSIIIVHNNSLVSFELNNALADATESRGDVWVYVWRGLQQSLQSSA